MALQVAAPSNRLATQQSRIYALSPYSKKGAECLAQQSALSRRLLASHLPTHACSCRLQWFPQPEAFLQTAATPSMSLVTCCLHTKAHARTHLPLHLYLYKIMYRSQRLLFFTCLFHPGPLDAHLTVTIEMAGEGLNTTKPPIHTLDGEQPRSRTKSL